MKIRLLVLELGQFLAKALFRLLDEHPSFFLVEGTIALAKRILDGVLDQILDRRKIEDPDAVSLSSDRRGADQPRP